jgi:hypothetical protein
MDTILMVAVRSSPACPISLGARKSRMKSSAATHAATANTVIKSLFPLRVFISLSLFYGL